MTPYEKICGQKYKKEILPLGEQDLSRRPGANANQLLQPWVAGLWQGRDTLGGEHLTEVMRSRAVRRLQEQARWVPEALLQRLAYEKPMEAGTLPRFIQTSTSTATEA